MFVIERQDKRDEKRICAYRLKSRYPNVRNSLNDPYDLSNEIRDEYEDRKGDQAHCIRTLEQQEEKV